MRGAGSFDSATLIGMRLLRLTRLAPLLVCLMAPACLTTDVDMLAGHEALRNADWTTAIERYQVAAARFRDDSPPSKRYALAIYYQADAMLTEPMSESAPEAEALTREALAIRDDVVGPRRLSTLSFLSRIAQARKDQNDSAGAEEIYALSDEIAAENLPPEHELMRARESGLRFELAGHPDEIELLLQP